MDWARGDSAGRPMRRDSASVRLDSARTTGQAGPHPVSPIPDGLPFGIVQAPGDTVTLWPSYSPKSFIPDSLLWDRDAIVRLLDSARREIVVQLLTYAIEDRGRRDDAIDVALR